MVLVQPEYEHSRDGTVPFRISNACKQTQIDLIGQAFAIRAAESQERGVPVPFILFPEAAIPVVSADGLDVLQRQMQEASGEIVFIGGLEGLTGDEARRVAGRFNAPEPVFGGAITNLCVIAIRSSDGQCSWNFQAKLRPSQWEQPRNMARGQQVLYFVAPKVAFLCQICFDHIAQEGEEPLNHTVCCRVVGTTRPSAATLDFLFVPQYNPKPTDRSFRQNTSRVVNLQDRLFQNNMTAVVVVNKAATLQESSEFRAEWLPLRSGTVASTFGGHRPQRVRTVRLGQRYIGGFQETHARDSRSHASTSPLQYRRCREPAASLRNTSQLCDQQRMRFCCLHASSGRAKSRSANM